MTEAIDLQGESYFAVLAALHAKLQPTTYFEIGTQTGASLQHARCASIAVDPAFRLGPECLSDLMRKPALHLFEETSDDFFLKYDPTAIFGRKIDLAFLDGMHLCEFLLRDFINTERFCNPASTIVLHDCLPVEAGIAGRNGPEAESTSPSRQGWWAGDVWRTALLIKRRRSDLTIQVYDAYPIGLVIISGLDPSNTNLSQGYDDFVKDMLEWDYKAIGLDGLVRELNVQPTSTLRKIPPASLAVGPENYKRQVIDEPVLWTKPQPLFALHSLGSANLMLAMDRKHALFLDEFTDAYLYGRDLIVADGLVHTRDEREDVKSLTLDHISSENEAASDVATTLRKIDGNIACSQDAIANAICLDEATLVLTPGEYQNYGMWLLQVIPGAYALKKNSRFSRVIAPTGREWHRSFLRDVLPDMAMLIEQNMGQVYAAPMLGMLRYDQHYLSLSAFEIEAVNDFADAALASNSSPFGEKIFISRFGATARGAHRGLENEAELVGRMIELGFDIVEPEHFPLKIQAAIFRTAKIIVGLGGAGMFNIVFCRPDTLIVSIERSADFAMQHSNLFASCTNYYGFIFGDVGPSVASNRQDRWKLETSWVIETLERHIS